MLWNALTDSGDLEDRSWLHLTASTDLRAVTVTQQQRNTLYDLSERGDDRWQRFMQRVLATMNNEDTWE